MKHIDFSHFFSLRKPKIELQFCENNPCFEKLIAVFNFFRLCSNEPEFVKGIMDWIEKRIKVSNDAKNCN